MPVWRKEGGIKREGEGGGDAVPALAGLNPKSPSRQVVARSRAPARESQRSRSARARDSFVQSSRARTISGAFSQSIFEQARRNRGQAATSKVHKNSLNIAQRAHTHTHIQPL